MPLNFFTFGGLRMLKKTTHAVRLATLGLVSAGAMMASQSALAEVSVSASMEVSNIYLWRGFDLGGGAVVAGDITVDSGFGLYGGIWGSSGDGSLGQEYDLFVGYGLEAGDFSLDISIWNYIYPSADRFVLDADGNPTTEKTGNPDSFADLSEVIVAAGAFGLTLEYYKVVTVTDTQYYTASYGVGDFGVKLGMHDVGGETMTHVDLSYAFNDDVSFTVSQVVDQEDGGGHNERPLFKVSYGMGWDLE